MHTLHTAEYCAYVIVRGLLTSEENHLVLTAARLDHRMLESAYDLADTQGGRTKLSLWNHPGDDIYGMVSRSQRIVDRMELFLGGEVYHYHSKMTMKEPYPEARGSGIRTTVTGIRTVVCSRTWQAASSLSIPATRENGCLQVLQRLPSDGPD